MSSVDDSEKTLFILYTKQLKCVCVSVCVCVCVCVLSEERDNIN